MRFFIKENLLKLIIITGIAFFASPIFVYATSGACSWHGGVNCGIGAINNRAVCYDNWLSSVAYNSMVECIGFSSSCGIYLNESEYTLTKNALKNEIDVLQTEIDKLRLELNSLDYKELQAILEYEESLVGRGVSGFTYDTRINAIHREYERKNIEVSYEIDLATYQYNEKVEEYNSICIKYTDEQKNNVCTKNLGSEYKYNDGFCIAPPPPPPTCTSWVYSDWGECKINGIQTRTIISSLPEGCTGGNPITFQSCSFKIPICTSWFYSDWSNCVDGKKTREIISSRPLNCKGGNSIISQSCQEKLINDNINIEEVKGVKVVADIVKETITKEKELMQSIDKKLSSKLKGRILLQVENHGEAWYVNPKDEKKYYMANGDEAYNIMRNLGVGITNKDLEKIKSDKNFAKKHSGKIFLQVEDKGQAYYIDFNGEEHYLKNGEEAYSIMRDLGLGITNNDIRKIDIN